MKLGRLHAGLAIPLLPLVLLTVAGASRLVPIPCLSGFVTDTGGAPVAEADLDFTNSITGDRLVTPGDNTDGAGFYNVCVLPGIYDVSFAPPYGSHLMGKLVPAVDLRADQGLELDVTLEFGTVVSGEITDGSGLPVGEVDVDVDRVGGGRIYTPDDNSDPVTGVYRVVIPDGLHRFRFEPPPGSRLRGAEVDSVQVDGDRSLDVSLVEGVLLAGRVSETGGGGVLDVDVDLRHAETGAKIFVANNSTDENGDYEVAVPTGTVQLRFAPVRGSRHVAALIDDFTIGGDRDWNQDLPLGELVTLVVRDPAGDPVPGADVDIKIAATGAKIFTPHDRTDIEGMSPSAVPAGMYTIQIDPPVGTILDRLVLETVPVVADTTIVVVLAEVPRVSASGRVVDERGAGLAGIVFDPRLLPGGTGVYVPDDATDTDGYFDLALPTGDYDVAVVPPRGARLVGLAFSNVTARQDSVWGEITLDDGWLVTVTVQDDLGRPVVDADLDLVDTATGETIYTPHDNTDATGQAIVALPAGTFRVLVEPPTGSDLQGHAVDDVVVGSDTEVSVTLARRSPGTPQPVTVLPNQPNPFNAGTTITYTISAAADVTVAVFDARGRRVVELESASRDAGTFTVAWDGRDARGSAAASGTYIAEVRSSLGTQTLKMALVR